MALTNKEYLEVAKAAITRWAELTCDEIDREQLDKLDSWDQLYIRALWQKRLDVLLKITKYIQKKEDERSKYDLIAEIFGDQLGLLNEGLQSSIQSRLQWMKSRVAKEFEKRVMSEIGIHGVASPIEQIFLMEWIFGKHSEDLGVKLIPQKPIETERGNYIVDFMIIFSTSESKLGRVVIELDGHDFHEKSKNQVMRDKIRERALISSGATVLRFSGSEVFRNPRACVEEVVAFIQNKIDKQ